MWTCVYLSICLLFFCSLIHSSIMLIFIFIVSFIYSFTLFIFIRHMYDYVCVNIYIYIHALLDVTKNCKYVSNFPAPVALCCGWSFQKTWHLMCCFTQPFTARPTSTTLECTDVPGHVSHKRSSGHQLLTSNG